MSHSLYERIGGEAAVSAAVDLFYDKVLADARIKHFFSNTDMTRQRQHRKMFLTYAFGGHAASRAEIGAKHHQHLVERLGSNDMHFDAVLENIAASLREPNVPDALIAGAAAIAESTRHDVLGK